MLYQLTCVGIVSVSIFPHSDAASTTTQRPYLLSICITHERWRSNRPKLHEGMLDRSAPHGYVGKTTGKPRQPLQELVDFTTRRTVDQTAMGCKNGPLSLGLDRRRSLFHIVTATRGSPPNHSI